MKNLLLGALGRPGFRSVLAGVVVVSIPVAAISGASSGTSVDVATVSHTGDMTKSDPPRKVRKATPKYLDLSFTRQQKAGPFRGLLPVRALSKAAPYCKPTPKHLDLRSAECLTVIAGRSMTEHQAEVLPGKMLLDSSTILSIERWSSPPRGKTIWTVRSRYDALIQFVAQSHDVDPALVKAIVQAESAFDPHAVSHKGARGLMQVLPETASLFAIENLSDPHQNLKAGVKYLKHLLELFDQDVTMAVAAYNAGPNTVLRHQGVPPYNETQQYLVKVLGLREAYASQRS